MADDLFNLDDYIIKVNGESVEPDSDSAPCASEHCRGLGRVSIDDLLGEIDECKWCRSLVLVDLVVE
jgi:hypothetical protein